MSVYKRGNVYWYKFWFRGQRIRESTGLTNKVAAQQAESIRKAALAEGRAGIAGPKPIVNFGDFVSNEFLPWAVKQYQSHPRTYERYRESTKPLLTSFEKLRLDAVSKALVEKFKVNRSSEVMPATANRDLAAQVHRDIMQFEKDGVLVVERWTDSNHANHDRYRIVEEVIDEYQRPKQKPDVERPSRYKKPRPKKGWFSTQNQPGRVVADDE